MKFKFLFLLLNLYSIFCEEIQIDPWNISSYPYPNVDATVGDTVNWTWVGQYTVFQFLDFNSYNNCDFSGATLINVTSPATILCTSVGLFYYGCSIPNHCYFYNMKVIVNVTGAVTTELPITTVEQSTQLSASNDTPTLYIFFFSFLIFLL